ncbi:MAG: hypothetical protein JSV89_19725 [Spirochaetaceae bacterium]|nr:MAG: hypothetical protein JSV89_19725 [Spirochaetaceae bacterium]
MIPSLISSSNGEWRLGAWDMVLEVADKQVARKLFKIIKWTYRTSKQLSDKVDRGMSSYIEPEVIAAWKSRFEQLVSDLCADEKSLLHRFYKSSFWFTNVGLLYARWAEETSPTFHTPISS